MNVGMFRSNNISMIIPHIGPIIPTRIGSNRIIFHRSIIPKAYKKNPNYAMNSNKKNLKELALINSQYPGEYVYLDGFHDDIKIIHFKYEDIDYSFLSSSPNSA